MLLLLPAFALGAAFRLLPGGPASVPAPAILSGHLAHAPAGDSVRLTYSQHYGRNGVRTALSPTGDFKVVLTDLKEGTPIAFSYANERTALYLSPGDQVRMDLDFARFDETVKYSGRGADVSNYVAQSLYKFEFGPVGSVPRPEYSPTVTVEQFRAVADNFRQQRRAFLAAYAKAHPLPADFRRNAAFDIDLKWAIQLLELPAYRRNDNPKSAAPPATYFDFLAQLPLKKFDPYLKDRGIDGNTAVMRFLTAYTNRLLPANGRLSTDPTEAGRLYAQATADFGLSASRERAMFQLFSWKLTDEADAVLAAYPTFQAQSRDSTFSRDLRNMLSQQLRIRPGQEAPAFTLLNHEGRQVSLSDLRGKVVYLDFWGTWCGPCMQEMPASLALRKKFEGRDVAFVYISVGDQEDKWQKVLAAEHLAGPASVHLRSTPQNDVASRYQVSRYPTYWLIGRDGCIINGQAPRPSEGETTVAAINTALAR